MIPRLILSNCLSGSNSRVPWPSPRGVRSRTSTVASSLTPVFSGRSTRTCPRAAPTCPCHHCLRVPSRPYRPARVLAAAFNHGSQTASARQEETGDGGHSPGARDTASHRRRHQRRGGDQVPSGPPARP
ncbi:DNA terminal protein [Human adenovirus 4p]|uniref:DNA terminal protein n=2 Tax=Human mastadenovirus E TaxID=130308 RepID=A0A3G9CMS7_ADE04|nr:DNA terminal protein [Human mastadenovirus E]BAU59104.1 DNA terminal protein [Human adenovirus 4p]BAU59223.1 DNA terminal protein [Human adenovirus 4p]